MQNFNQKITLMTTLGCHLCEDALAMLRYYQDQTERQFTIELLEITENEKLLEEYGVRIPVLKHSESGRELAWPFNSEQLVKFMQDA